MNGCISGLDSIYLQWITDLHVSDPSWQIDRVVHGKCQTVDVGGGGGASAIGRRVRVAGAALESLVQVPRPPANRRPLWRQTRLPTLPRMTINKGCVRVSRRRAPHVSSWTLNVEQRLAPACRHVPFGRALSTSLRTLQVSTPFREHLGQYDWLVGIDPIGHHAASIISPASRSSCCHFTS